jgi:sugar/nucleoside kinase (ribokinase family)
MKKFQVCTLGSITLDTFLEPLEIILHTTKDGRMHMDFEVGQKIQMKTVAQHIGGGAANSAVGFARLGMNVSIMGTIGNDDHGDFILHRLKQMKVSTDSIVVKKNIPSSTSLVFLTPDGQRTIFNEQTAHTPFRKIPRTRAVYLGHVHQAGLDIFDRLIVWKKKSENRFFTKMKFIGWNPGKSQFESGFSHFKTFFPVVDLLILNREEAELFTEIKTELISPESLGINSLWCKTSHFQKNFQAIADIRKVAQKFLEAGVTAVVITDGMRGAQYISQDEYLWAPTLNDEDPVSTLGAGDAFAVGCMGAALMGKPASTQMLWGTKNSDSVVRTFGAQEGLLGRGEF